MSDPSIQPSIQPHLLQQLEELLPDGAGSAYNMEVAAVAGLLDRQGSQPKRVPRWPLPLGQFQDSLQELADLFPSEDSPEPEVADWALAVDEVLAASEWCRVDITQCSEWDILLGLVHAFPEALMGQKRLATRLLEREGVSLSDAARKFWELIRDVEPPTEETN